MTVSLEPIKRFFSNKTVRLIAILLLTIGLLILVYFVFLGEQKESDGYKPTEREERLLVLLTGLDGVQDAKVMITEEDGAAVGAVIIFEGEDGFLTRIRLREIAAAALNIAPDAVLVYAAEA